MANTSTAAPVPGSVRSTRRGGPKPPRRLDRGRRAFGAALFAPSFALIAIFVYGFIAFSVRVSVAKDYSPLSPDLTATANPLSNYATLMATPRFQADLRNIVIFTVLLLIVATAVGLGLAVLVHNTIRASGFFRSGFLLPYALSFVVTGVIWRWIFTPQTGVNLLLQYTGISGIYEHATGKQLDPQWITDPKVAGSLNDVLAAVFPSSAHFLQAQLGIPIALIPVVVAAVWQLSGFAMALFLAGLGGIPEETLEASRMDGANAWQTFWRIIVPQLRPTFVVALVLLGQIALRSFDLVYAMVGTGPGFATDIPAIFIYDQMFQALHYNVGAAASIVLLVLVAVIIVPYLIRVYSKEDA